MSEVKEDPPAAGVTTAVPAATASPIDGRPLGAGTIGTTKGATQDGSKMRQEVKPDPKTATGITKTKNSEPVKVTKTETIRDQPQVGLSTVAPEPESLVTTTPNTTRVKTTKAKSTKPDKSKPRSHAATGAKSATTNVGMGPTTLTTTHTVTPSEAKTRVVSTDLPSTVPSARSDDRGINNASGAASTKLDVTRAAVVEAESANSPEAKEPRPVSKPPESSSGGAGTRRPRRSEGSGKAPKAS